MSMKSANSPRRVYPRAGSLVLCLSGKYFGPKGNSETAINPDKEVRHEMLDKSGGKARIQVTQKIGSKPAVSETWIEKSLTFESRASASA